MLRRTYRYIAPYWPKLATVLLLSLTGTLLSLILPYLSKGLLEALLARDPHRLARLVFFFACATAISFLLNVAAGLLYTRASAGILFDMRLALYQHLLRLSPRFYARTRLGEIVSRLNNDIGEIQRVAAETALAWVGNVVFLVGTIVLMVWLDFRLFLLSVALIPASLWTLVHYRRQLEARVATMRQRSADIGSFLVETLRGARLAVVSRAQERESGRFREKNDSFIDALMDMQRLTYLSGGLPGVILSASTVLVFLYGGHRVMTGALSLGSFVAFLAFQMRLLSPVQAMMGLYSGLATARVSLDRVEELFATQPEIVEKTGAIALPGPVRGQVEFEHVTFTFDRQAPVLDSASFTVEPGETVALMGPSGSGKSTVADLLLRLLDPDAGTIRLDGCDLRDLRLDEVRACVGLVEQEPFLFHASVADNLRYARPDAGDEDLQHAARAAGIHDFIIRLPNGYDTTVGERGLALSAGERQRLAIARALVANPAVLILDEPTAALDTVAENRVAGGLGVSRRGMTTIVITHRAELAARADRVITLAE
jgi:ATP-binding cassette, subfamily B, bacterial